MGDLHSRHRRWGAKVVFHALVILLLLHMGVAAFSSLVSDSIGPREAIELWGQLRPQRASERVRIRVDDGRGHRGSRLQESKLGEEGRAVHSSRPYEPEGDPWTTHGAATGSGGAEARKRPGHPEGMSVAIYFEPTKRLMDFLTAIDQLDREKTLDSIDKFLAEQAHMLAELELFLPVQGFFDSLAAGKSMPDAVIQTMKTHGMKGKAALDRVIDIKRGEYATKLDKYLRLKFEHGVDKPHKILTYEQKVWMVDELQSELNNSFNAN